MISVTNTFTKKLKTPVLEISFSPCWLAVKEASDVFYLPAWEAEVRGLRFWGVSRRGRVICGSWKVTLLARGKWHDDDDFDRSLPPRWTRVPRQRPRWVVRPKSVFSDGRDLVDRDVNCRPVDWKYDNFPVQEMAPPRNLGRSHLKTFTTPTTARPICSTNLLRLYRQRAKTRLLTFTSSN